MEEAKIVFEGENYRGSGQGAMNIKDILLKAYERCLVEGSKEMVGPKTETNKAGFVHKTNDQRLVFINSVKSLQTALFPHILENAEVQAEMNVHLEELEVIENKYKKELEAGVEKERRYNMSDGPSIEFDAEPVFNKALEELVKKYRELLMTLATLLHSRNYFEEV